MFNSNPPATFGCSGIFITELLLLSRRGMDAKVRLFSTCPQAPDHSQETYVKRLIEVARWSDEVGCEGILIYTDNRLLDGWLIAQLIIENTKQLCPLLAVQPAYMHPYSVAKMIASMAYLHSRRVCLNMVAGGFLNDLATLNDRLPHDRRYDRLVEYTTIIRSLLSTSHGVSYSGDFYILKNAKMSPVMPAELFPDIFMSGSSEAGLAAAKAVGAIPVKYPKGPSEEQPLEQSAGRTGIRIGVIARRTEEEAWDVAHMRFPEDRKGQLAHELAMKTSDSLWHKQLSEGTAEQGPYWLHPFQTYKTFCPYLVGSYATVAREVESYISLGYRDFIFDIPPTEEELNHTMQAFSVVSKVAA
jgi:alkanesulfonate monooxygenase